jgi:hypothetical protein
MEVRLWNGVTIAPQKPRSLGRVKMVGPAGRQERFACSGVHGVASSLILFSQHNGFERCRSEDVFRDACSDFDLLSLSF